MADAFNDRFMRQARVFSEERRRNTGLLVLNSGAVPDFTRTLLAGAAAMGIPWIAVDDVNPTARASHHWLHGSWRTLVARIDKSIEFLVAADSLPLEDQRQVTGREALWSVVVVRRSADPAMRALTLTNRVLLVGFGRSRLCVFRITSVDDLSKAIATLESAGCLDTAGAPLELCMVAAGICLDAIVRAQNGPAAPDELAFYDLALPRRVMPENADSANSAPGAAGGAPGAVSLPAALFKGRQLAIVGAGALANWAVLAPALEGAHLDIYDGDPEVAPHNLNRQILLIDGVGTGLSKVEVLAREIRRMVPGASVRAYDRYIHRPGDFETLENIDALLCLPDNDEARLLCADVAHARGIVYATAGSSAFGGQAVIVQPGRACYRCVAVRGNDPPRAAAGSCAAEASDAIVSCNMVAAGLLISELRQAFAGCRSANLRFVATAPRGNRLDRMIADPPCPHIVCPTNARARGAGSNGVTT